MTIATLPVEDRDYSLHELLEEALVCKASFHPHHSGCGQQAVYVLHLMDIDHDIKHAVPLCDDHSFSYYVGARDNVWCECVEPHRYCEYDDVQLVSVS